MVAALVGAYLAMPADANLEKEWDEASKAEAALFGTEMVVGAAAAILASPTGPGAVAAYCGASMAISTAGAWVLAGYMAEDKWPNGINQ